MMFIENKNFLKILEKGDPQSPNIATNITRNINNCIFHINMCLFKNTNDDKKNNSNVNGLLRA